MGQMTREQALELAYVLIVRLAELRLDLQPHEKGVLSHRTKMALENLREFLQPLLPEDLDALAAELRKLATEALGFQPEVKDRGEILDLKELIDSAGLKESPVALALIRAMQGRCEEVTGSRFIGKLWGGSGESMRAVLTIGGIRVPIMAGLRSLNNFVKQLADARAAELVTERVNDKMDQLQEVVDHAVAQIRGQFEIPDTDLEEQVEEEQEPDRPLFPPGHHRCLKCDEVYHAERLGACPKCGHPRPVWFNKETDDE